MVEYEHKFLVDIEIAQVFLARCAGYLVPEVYDRRRPVAYARTLYLDTADRALYRGETGDWACRLRIREYAAAPTTSDPPVLTGCPIVELKRTRGVQRTKVRAEQQVSLARALAAGDAPVRGLPFELPLAGAAERRLWPQHTTWYRRLSFVAPSVRITVDESLCYCVPEPPGREGGLAEPNNVVARAATAVLEIKMTEPPRPWLAEAMQHCGRRARYSKFRTGVALLRKAGQASRATLALPRLSVGDGLVATRGGI